MKTLIVEDDFQTRSLFSTILSKYGICHVAVNGKEALDAVERAFDENIPYDLICMDIMMPVMDGQEALLELRRMEEQRGIKGLGITKVIMITGLDDSKNIIKAFRQGQCEAFLPKPLDKNKLLGHIRDLGLIE